MQEVRLAAVAFVERASCCRIRCAVLVAQVGERALPRLYAHLRPAGWAAGIWRWIA